MFPSIFLALSTLASLSSTSPIQKRSLNGPVIAANFPDPSIIQVGSTWYSFGTNNGVHNVQIATSDDFNTWTVLNQDALPHVGAWSNGQNVWAPDVIQIGSNFVLYYTAVNSAGQTHCVGAASSANILGPYTPQANSIACPVSQGGAIDPSGFQDPQTGTLYIVYKVDGNSIGHGGNCNNGIAPYVSTPIILQQMSSDGLSPMGDPVQILDRSDADGPLIEAPSMMKVGGTYFCFFSSNCFNGPYYDISYATAPSVTGPWTKSGAPLLVTGSDNNRLYSPGGASVTKDGQRIVFHADLGTTADTRQMWTGMIAVSGTTVTI